MNLHLFKSFGRVASQIGQWKKLFNRLTSDSAFTDFPSNVIK